MSGQSIFEPSMGTSAIDHSFNVIEPVATKSYPRLSDAFQNLISRAEAANLVKEAVSTNVELVDYQLRPFSEEKLGFLGSHLCLIITVRKLGTNYEEKHSFFVKTLPYDVPSQAAYIVEKGCFKKESDFFTNLVPLLTKNYKGESWAPKCYLVKENLLVFEDMKAKGFFNRARELDEGSLKAAIACIARLHACSLLAEEELADKSIRELHPELFVETEFQQTGRGYTWYKNAIDLAVDVANDMGLDTSRIHDACERVFDISEPSKTKRNVVSHGDLWSSNMIFDGYDNCKLVDFQLVRYSPLAHDLMQLMFLTTSRKFRKEREADMIEHYYKILKEILMHNEYRSEIPSFGEVLQGVGEQKFAALVTAVIFHPTVLMDGKTAAKIMDDPETYESYYFKNRKPFVDEIMASFPDYEKKIKENVQELVEMSLIVDALPRPT